MFEKSLEQLILMFKVQNDLYRKSIEKDDLNNLNIPDLIKIRDDYNLEDTIANDKINKDVYYFQFINELKYEDKTFSLKVKSKEWIEVIDNLIHKNIIENISNSD